MNLEGKAIWKISTKSDLSIKPPGLLSLIFEKYPSATCIWPKTSYKKFNL